MTERRTFGPLAAFLFTTIALAFAGRPALAQPVRVTLPGHVVPAVNAPAIKAVPKSASADAAPISLTIVLRRWDEDAFQRDLAALYDPASPTYRQWLTPKAIADRYGPFDADYEAVERHFVSEGFEVAERSANRLTLVVEAPRATVERALDVNLVDYEIPGVPAHAKRAFANDRDPSLPSHIAARVMAINGLSSTARARPLIIEAIKKTWCSIIGDVNAFFNGVVFQDPVNACTKAVTQCASDVKLSAQGLTDLILACSKWNPPKPDQKGPDTRGAPHDPVAWKDADGSGQKIGITAFSAFLMSDVADTLEMFGYRASMIDRLSRVSLNGGAALDHDQVEVVLDATTALTAVGGAQVVVYDMPFAGGAFQALFNRMITDGVTIITNSWAYCENQTSYADVSSIDAILATAAAAGITVITASGDSGSTCLNGSPNTIVVPAGSPHITAVGGTSLETGPGRTYKNSTWWGSVANTPPTGQGGYGVSRFFARPAWQNGFTTSATRSIPDLAFQADPARGVTICVAALGPCPNDALYGGTSYAAPAVAAAVAKINQAAGHRLGLLNPQIYALSGSGAFNAPATLGSDFAHVGLGTPVFNRLFLALTSSGPGVVSATQSIVESEHLQVAANGTGYTNVIVKLRDANGNIVSGKNVSLSHDGTPAVTVTPPSSATNAMNGAAIFQVHSTSVQNVTFTATDTTDGIVLATTIPVSFVVPLAAAGGIQAFPATVANNGTATTTITISLQDAGGNPTPGKVVTLSQGNGHSVITAPSPAVTNAAGQIVFTATNRIAETVTYTAAVETDGDVPVPGSAVVTFSGQASTQCAGAITPAPGYAATPFITGFVAETFSFSNINFGCAGAQDPNFDPTGRALISNYRSGEFLRLPAEGGAVTSANVVSTPGQSLQRTVFGKDGKLYAARSATGAGFFSGVVQELDPQTGAVLRTLASNLPCVSPMAVDPLSGDLFFTGQCFGSGSDDARLLRIGNPGSATPVLSTYATLPGTPNGAVAFAPDGTMFVAITYLAATPPVVRVSGTNQPQPPTVTPVPGINSAYWVNVGETLPSGAAKSLIVNTSDQKLRLADITTNPPTFTDILTTGASTGSVGPDRCLYISNGETVYRITNAGGACGFATTAATPAISLTPANASPNPAQGSAHTVTARLLGVPPTAGIAVNFEVGGANADYRLVRTDANGVATLTYIGTTAGLDVIAAHALVGTQTLLSNRVEVTWTAGKHVSFVTLNQSVAEATVGAPVTVSASVADASAGPPVPIAGITLTFNVGGQTCNGVTNANGVASCSVSVPLIGAYTLTVTFAGNGQFNPSSDGRAFHVTAAPTPPCFAFNDVDVTSGFCPNVEWMRNRAVTLGCTTTLYCPVDYVTRLQMAAFMNRLGTTLSGETRFVGGQPGALALDANPVVCQTADLAPTNFDRRIVVDASFSAFATASVGFAADAVASFDAGATWVPLASAVNRAFAAASHWGHLRARGVADIDAGDTVRLGLRIGRGGIAGAANPTDSTCKLRALVTSR